MSKIQASEVPVQPARKEWTLRKFFCPISLSHCGRKLPKPHEKKGEFPRFQKNQKLKPKVDEDPSAKCQKNRKPVTACVGNWKGTRRDLRRSLPNPSKRGINKPSTNQIIKTTYIEGNVYNGPAPRNPQEALKIYRDVMASMTSSLSMRGIDLRASDPNTQRAIGLANVYID